MALLMITIILLIELCMGIFQWIVYHETVFTLKLMKALREAIKADIASAVEANEKLSGVLADMDERFRKEVAEREKPRSRRKPARVD